MFERRRNRHFVLVSRACVVVLVCVSQLAATHIAHAGEWTDAHRAFTEERYDDAARHLVAFLETGTKDPALLRKTAWMAQHMGDLDLLQRVREAAETLEQAASVPERDLALGFAYLGLAETHLKNGTGGSSVAFLFTDAVDRAKRATDAGERHHPLSLYLHARALYAQGDLDGALSVLDGKTKGDDDGYIALAAQHGTYLYGKGSKDARGEGRALLEQALERLAYAFGRFTSFAQLPPSLMREARMARAWSAHWLGDLDEARAFYLEAHRLGGNTAHLARRGLMSLYANDTAALTAALLAAANASPKDLSALDALADVYVRAKDHGSALKIAQRRIAADERDPAGWTLAGTVLHSMRQWGEARKHYVRALELDSGHLPAAGGLERVAQALVPSEFERGLAIYQELLRLRPKDPYARNNLGFILREVVSPHTNFEEGGIQRLKPEAPARVRELLFLCRDVYAEATALIPEADDESRDLYESWNLAGIVNDYGLMIHYFADIQDAEEAERVYQRVLRMTEDSFKDTYSPNLQRLYRFVLPNRDLTWYRTARRCKDAVLMESRDAEGRLRLVPDERKRAAAARDERGLRARIVRELREDAEADGDSWPPRGANGNGR